MTIDVAVSAAIARTPEDVAAYLADPRNDPDWIGGLVEVVPPSEPLRVGTQVERVARFMGRRVEYVMEVESLDPGRLLTLRSVRAPFPMRVTYQVAPDEGGSDISLRVQGGPGGLAKFLHPLMAFEVRRNLSNDLRRLKARLEGAS